MIIHSNESDLVFRLSENAPDALKQVLLQRGWVEYKEERDEDVEWNLWWKSQRFRRSDHLRIEQWQRLNHFPKTDAITRKDCLVRNLRRMKCVYGGSAFNFHPLSYILPNEYTKFVSDYSRESQSKGEDSYWICKPADLSRGRGIFVFKELKDLNYDCPVIVQRYISSPLLISGYKFDLRIYVCVPSFKPLTIYIHQEGIVRFGTEKFDLGQLENLFSHLTNTSINKYGPAYSTDKERVGAGCKWTLSQLRSFLRQLGNVDEAILWQRISNIVTLTIATQAPTVPQSPGCFELFGFDILVDENLKPWLLEVNFSPALGIDCQADLIVKHSLLNDLVDLLNFKPSDAEKIKSSPRTPVPKWSDQHPPAHSPYQRQIQNEVRMKKVISSQYQIHKPTSQMQSTRNRITSKFSIIPSTGEATKSAKSSHSSSAVFANHSSRLRGISSHRRKSKDSSSEEADKSSSQDGSQTKLQSANKRPTQLKMSKRNSSSLPLINFQQTPALSDCKGAVRKLRTAPTSQDLQHAGGSLSERGNSNPGPSSLTLRKHKDIKSANGGLVNDKESLCTGNSDVNTLPKREVTKRGGRKKAPVSYKSPYSVQSTSASKSTTSNPWPRTRVGDFILTFPWNETLRRQSCTSIDIKAVIGEQKKVMKKLNDALKVENGSGAAGRRSSTTISSTDARELSFMLKFQDKECNPLYFWGPQNPPLLSNVLS